ncbi:alveolin domain containing intermediate filament IMC1 [Cardiosporidium cionae]|uniref:Alveolin domain containing intermediate filament IMC1 n=1 Tax=Cardiosporidium cionae TaxID=476202 RepID=A0ABQ7JET4_9APIC|nr:alveolin domain containing intermediate filament IMC1 [Cardiosporidium cionae]|eukprot:KAF8822516.1 alveolin domain containing intermediate filament IMC1 [Cardiosporidium cionae]
MFSNCSDCCAQNAQENENGEKIQISTEEKIDRSRATEISLETKRHWVPIPAYQPVDTVTKTVEVPVVQARERYVPKMIIEEKIVEEPKYIYERVEKIVEVPEVRMVDKIVEVPQYHYQYKYIPKIETKENIVQHPKTEVKYIEKIVEVPQIKEVIRYQDIETVEEVIRYVPKGQKIPDIWAKTSQEQQGEIIDESSQRQQTPSVSSAGGPQTQGATIPGTPFPAYPTLGDVPGQDRQAPRLEQIFKPKVVKNVEIQKHVPISVDVPVPYMVPKPMLVPVHVPVLKFRDHFVPVPVRRVVLPRIRWTNEVYEVECIKEKPFLQVQDVIKPVPCDVEINVHEFVDKAQPINPTELSQADIHAMWMRVNADLAEKRKEELGENYPYVKHPPGTVFGEAGSGRGNGDSGQADEGSPDPEAGKEASQDLDPLKVFLLDGDDQKEDPISLHPGHPLSMTYLQNQWMKKDTTTTHQMYTPEWFEAHQKALHSLSTQHLSQAKLSAEQAAMFQPENPAFGDAPWIESGRQPTFDPFAQNLKNTQESDSKCKSSCRDDPNPDAACCGPC